MHSKHLLDVKSPIVPSFDSSDTKELRLASWCMVQMRKFKKGLLSKYQMSLLKQIPGWPWKNFLYQDKCDTEWTKKVIALRLTQILQNGKTNKPISEKLRKILQEYRIENILIWAKGKLKQQGISEFRKSQLKNLIKEKESGSSLETKQLRTARRFLKKYGRLPKMKYKKSHSSNLAEYIKTQVGYITTSINNIFFNNWYFFDAVRRGLMLSSLGLITKGLLEKISEELKSHPGTEAEKWKVAINIAISKSQENIEENVISLNKEKSNTNTRSFEKAKQWAKGLMLRNRREWIIYKKYCRYPRNVPRNPEKFYKEWQGIEDWLGIHKISGLPYLLYMRKKNKRRISFVDEKFIENIEKENIKLIGCCWPKEIRRNYY